MAKNRNKKPQATLDELITKPTAGITIPTDTVAGEPVVVPMATGQVLDLEDVEPIVVVTTAVIEEEPILETPAVSPESPTTAGYALIESSFKAIITASNYGNDLVSIASVKYSFILAIGKHLGGILTNEDLSKLIEDYKENLKLPTIQSACLKWNDEEARKAFCAFTMCINGIKGEPHLLSAQFTGMYETLGEFCAKYN